MTELDQRGAVHGVLWTAFQSLGVRLFSFIVFVLLARLLTPSDFGLLTMAGIFVSLGDALVSQGLGTAITQRDQIEPSHEYTAFWTNVGLAVAFAGLLWVAAPWIAAMFGSQALTGVIRWLSPVLVLRGAVGIPVALLQRRFQFRQLAMRSLAAALVGGVAGVAAALSGLGVYALVIQQFVGAAVDVLVVWNAAAWWPRLVFSFARLRELIVFSSYLLGSSLLGLVSRRADDFLIGLLLGDVALGIYAIAYRGLQVLEQILAKPGSVVAVPAFSRLQGQPERLRDAFHGSIQAASVLGTPVFVAVSLLAPLGVPLVFGPQYEQSGDVLAVLALIGVVHTVTYLDYAVYVGVGRPDVVLKLLVIRTVANVVLFLLVARFGIVAVATAYVCRAYALWPLNLVALKVAAGVSARRYVISLLPALTASAGMAIAMWSALQLPLGDVGLLLTCVPVGAIVYALALHRLAPGLVRDLRSKLGLVLRRESP